MVGEPIAYLLRKTERGVSSIIPAAMFKRQDAAIAAAERTANRWRTCVVVPVFEHPDPAPRDAATARMAASSGPEPGPGGVGPTNAPEEIRKDNAKRTGWEGFFFGRDRESCPFPSDRADLQRRYREGWDAAQAAKS